MADFFATIHASGDGEPHAIVRSWISQLAEQNAIAFNLIENEFSRTGHGVGRVASQAEIWQLFTVIVQTVPKCILILDGLDEYRQHRTEFLDKLKEAVKGTQTRVFISSREEVDISITLQDYISAENSFDIIKYKILSSDVAPDIRLYADHVTEIQLPKKPLQFREEMASTLASKSEGMFLWIKLQQSQLRGTKNFKELKRIIQNMPPGLKSIYDGNWKTILEQGPEDQARSICILRWATFAVRPLTLAELAGALLIRPDDPEYEFDLENLPEEIDDEYIVQEIKALCGCLIEVRDGKDTQSMASKTLHLAHPSVREYLLQKLPLPSGQDGQPDLHDIVLAKSCILYISCLELWGYFSRGLPMDHMVATLDDAIKENVDVSNRIRCYGCPFLQYASLSWYRHTTPLGMKDEELVNLINSFLRSDNKAFDIWRRLFEASPEPEFKPINPGNSMYYAAYFDLIPTMLHIKKKENPDLDILGGVHGTALQAACAKRNSQAIANLLDWGVDVDVPGGVFGSAVNAAIAEGNNDTTKLLLQKGASPNWRGISGLAAIQMAAYEGDIQMMTILLEHNATVDEFVNDVSLLYLASTNVWQSIVELLIEYKSTERDADSDHFQSQACGIGGSIAHTKSRTGEKTGVAAHLLTGISALHISAMQGHTCVIELLLKRKLDIEANDQEGCTALHYAANGNHVSALALLLNQGANIEATNKNTETALHMAATNGQVPAMEVLLKNGANIEATTNNGYKALHLAARKGQVPAMEVLLKNGANIEATTTDGDKALHLAARKGQVPAMEVLLKNGANIEATTIYGYKALHLAVMDGQVPAMEVLLKNGANIEVTTNNGYKALHLAAMDGQVPAMEVLLKNGANIDATINNGYKALHLAAMNGQVPAMEALLKNGANIEATTTDGDKALHLAARKGQVPAMEALLKNGANIEAAANHGYKALHFVALSGHLETVNLLVKNGVNVNSVTNDRQTPLSITQKEGHQEVADLLLKHGALRQLATMPIDQ